MDVCWRVKIRLILVSLILLGAGEVWAQEAPTQSSADKENSFTESVRDGAYGSLLETAGQPDRAFALYQQAWAKFRQDEVMARILAIAHTGPPNRAIVEFLENSEKEIADQTLRGKVRDYLDAMRAIMLAEYGRVILRTFPKDARVTLASSAETRRVGPGQTLWLLPGQSLIRSIARNHSERTHVLNVEPGMDQELVLILEPKNQGSLLNITTAPSGALVSIDGVMVGKSPIKEFQIRQGSYVLTAETPNHLPISEAILITDSKPMDINLNLEPTRVATRKDLVVAMNTNRTIERKDKAKKKKTFRKRKKKDRTRRFSPITEQADPGQAWRIAGWLTTGLGAALIGGSFVVAGKASESAQLASLVPPDPQFDADFEKYAQDYATYSLMYYAGLGVGALSVTGGILMVLLAPEDDELAFGASPVPGGGMVRSTIRF